MTRKGCVLLILAATVSCAPQAAPSPSPHTDAPAPQAGTITPDPGESPEAIAQYQEARGLIAQGQQAKARTILAQAVDRFPESRHLHQAYADFLWSEFKDRGDPGLLRQSADEAVRAAEIGLRSGEVDYALTARLAETLGGLRDKETLDRIFKKLLGRDPSSTVYLDYANGLALAGDDTGAENAFRSAVRSDPNGDAAARYAEWLLDRGRERDALEILPKDSPIYYLHFLRGVALERLGRAEEARTEYDRYREYSRTFPAPSRFRIAGSTSQTGIRFEDRENPLK